MKEEVHVRVVFKGKMAEIFKAVKERLGVKNNTEVVRTLLNKEFSRIKEANSSE